MHTVLVKSAHVCTHMAEQKGYGFLASPFVFSASFAFSSSPYIPLHIFHEKKKEQRTDTTICFNFITVLLFSIIKKLALPFHRKYSNTISTLSQASSSSNVYYYYSSVCIMLAKNFNCQWIDIIIKRITEK